MVSRSALFTILFCSSLAYSEKLAPLYDALFAKYSVEISGSTCAPLDFSSNKHARKFRTNIRNSNPNLTSSNFAGNKILIKNPLTTGSDWLVADCATGKFFPSRIVGIDVSFRRTSNLLIATPVDKEDDRATYQATAYGPPRLYVWQNAKLIAIPDPIINKK